MQQSEKADFENAIVSKQTEKAGGKVKKLGKKVNLYGVSVNFQNDIKQSDCKDAPEKETSKQRAVRMLANIKTGMQGT